MKKTLLLLLALVTVNLYAQEVPATFASDFKLIFESAKKTYKGDLGAEIKTLADKDFDKEFATKNKFQGALVSRLVTDKDGIVNHHAQFKVGISKDAALVTLGKYMAAAKGEIPSNFKENENVMMQYVNNRAHVFEYNSDDYSQISRYPTVTIGLVESAGVYYVDIRIMAPSFL